MLKTFALVLFAFIGFQTNAQVSIDIDETINQELRMKNARIDSTKISGYRIQIAFSSNMSKANASKTKFRSSFPEYANRTYSLYQQPYWKIRVGDFYREIDAQKLLAEVRVKFPNAFVVRDYIKRPKL
ncbi:MAG: SPOR domain-containing protein [Bacteroidia bacterium]|nr:SPOR domain-containing protein [Bacteroidia bacterium]